MVANHLKGIALAQGLSILLAATGITSGILTSHNVFVPTFQAFLNYVLLAVVCGGLLLRRRKPLAYHWQRYMALAFLDVEGNFLVTKAYQYTSITSVALLDCFAVPAVLLLSSIALKARYRISHYTGAGLCISGLILLVVSDNRSSSDQGSTSGSAPLLGDLLVLAGALLYAMNNVAQEALLAKAEPVELLGMLGVCGALLSGVQVLALELKPLLSVQWTLPVTLALLGFATAMFAFYHGVLRVLAWSGAAVLNISLLTSDLWTAAARVAVFGGFEGSAPSFAASLALAAAGIATYSLGGDVHGERGQGDAAAYQKLQVAEDDDADRAELDADAGDDVAADVEGGCSAPGGLQWDGAARGAVEQVDAKFPLWSSTSDTQGVDMQLAASPLSATS